MLWGTPGVLEGNAMWSLDGDAGADSGHKRLIDRDGLVEEMMAQIRQTGYYLVHLDRLPTEAVIDLRWAACIVGKQIGTRTTMTVSKVGEHEPGKTSVVIGPEGKPDAMAALLKELMATVTRLPDSRETDSDRGDSIAI